MTRDEFVAKGAAQIEAERAGGPAPPIAERLARLEVAVFGPGSLSGRCCPFCAARDGGTCLDPDCYCHGERAS